jgi:hypothetical protein|tara:strand:+ start:5216 stop:5407 length:192 start_codon:yes stop_codon:yes gene_type:complete
MKKLMILFAVAIATSCSPTDPSEIDPTLEVNASTSEKIKEAQDENIELEEIDGELDSIMQTLK